MWYVTMWQLMWEMWTAECTRCGGYGHTLSQCRWPPARPESKVE